nr:hypothetical protein [Tanacetum cinerariifolium]
TVSLLPVAPDRGESKLDVSFKRLFDEGGSGNQTEQGNSIGGKRKSMIADAGGASHPSKKLKEDHETLSEASVSGKSRSVLKRLLARAVLNAEVGVASMPTLHFMTASTSSTPEREGGDHIDSMAGLNLCAIRAPPRFIIYSESFYHSGTNVAEAEVDYLVKSSVLIMTIVTAITSTVDPASVAKKKLVEPFSICADSSSSGGTNPTTGVFSDLTGNDFFVGVIRTVIDPDTDLHKIYTFNDSKLHAMGKKPPVIGDGSKKVKLQVLSPSHLEHSARMTLYLEEKFYHHLLTTVSDHRWLLTHGMELAIVKCLNSPEYLFSLKVAIGEVIEKGMENITNQRSALLDVFVPLAEPFSAEVFTGTEDQVVADENAASFPNVDDAELNIPQ